MNESLSVPTATTFRTLPVAQLERCRKDLNAKLQSAGRPQKLSFTHLIAFALVQAAKRHPVMAHTLAEIDGAPYRVQPEGLGLGLAVDVQRKDGSRGLVVPVIKRADTLDFAAFHAAYEALVEKARTNKLLPDDFAGAGMTLTNPGGLGTVASVPRLMAGQGSIIAVGAIGYPAEYTGVPEERVRDLGIAKVMTVTSTYDHRVIQGAESGAFLATLDHLLQGEEHFYDAIAESLQLSAISYQLAPRRPNGPRAAAAAVAPDMLYHVGAAMALVKAFRTHGHLAAKIDPLGTEPLGDPAARSGPAGPDARDHGSDPNRRAADLRARRHAWPSRIPTSRRPTAVPSATRSSTSPATSSGCGSGRRSNRASSGRRSPPKRSGSSSAGSPGSRRWRSSSTRGTWATSASRSRAWTCWCRCSTSRWSWPRPPAPAKW